MPFGTGFITGLAKSIDRNLQEDMATLKEETSHLSKLRFQRGQREHERYTEEMKSNLDTIKDMSRKVGSTDAVQYLIDTYGYAEAQNVANLLYDRKNKSGGIFDIGGALGLEQRKGDSVTAKQLAEFVTPSMSIGKVTDFGQEAPGLMKLFGVDRGLMGAEIQKRSDKMLAAAGIPTDMKTAVDMPETLKGRGIREWELYALDEPAADARRLMSVSQTLYTQAMESGNKELLTEAYEARAAADSRLFEAQSLQNVGTRYSDTDVTRSMSNMTAQLAAANGVGDKGSYQGGVYTTGSMAADQANTLTDTAAFLTEVGSEARSNGVSASDIAVAQAKAIRENRTLIFNKSDDPFVRGGTFTFGEKDSLIENRSTLFPTVGGLGNTGVTVTQNQGTGNQGTTFSVQNLTVANAKAAYQGAQTGGQQQAILTELIRQLTTGALTGQKMDPADATKAAEKLLGI